MIRDNATQANHNPDGTRRRYIPPDDSPLPLFDQGETAASTRADAHAAAKPKRAARMAAAESALIEAGPAGLIRHELADAIGVPLASICSIALALLGEGRAIERGRRLSPYGSPAAVIIHCDHVMGESS